MEKENKSLAEIIQNIRNFDAEENSLAARNLAKSAVDQYPDSAELLAMITTLYLWQGYLQDAHTALDKAKVYGAELPLTWAAEADVACFEGDLDVAKQAAEQAIAMDSRDNWILARCINIFQWIEDYQRATELASIWQESYPDDPRGILADVTNLQMMNRREESERLLEKALQQFPDSPVVWVKKARQLYPARHLDEAIELLKKAVSKVDGNSSFWGLLALILSSANRFEEAEIAAQNALKISSVAVLAMQAMAQICRHRGQDKDAAKWKQKSANAIPALCQIDTYHEVNAAIRKGEWAKAVDAANKALSLELRKSSRSTVLELKGRALLHLKQPQQIEQVIGELEKLDRFNAPYFEFKAWLFSSKGDIQSAIQTYREGISKFPNFGGPRSGLLRLLHANKSRDEETELIKDIFVNLPHTPADYLVLITALDDTKHNVDCRQLRIIAQEKYPENEEFRIFEAVERFSIGDFAGATKIASTVKGEFRGIARLIIGLESKIKRFMMFVKAFFGKDSNGSGPTLH